MARRLRRPSPAQTQNRPRPGRLQSAPPPLADSGAPSNQPQPQEPDLSELEGFGRRVRRHYQENLPDQLKGLQEEGQDPAFFIRAQERWKELRWEMKDKLPPGGFEELVQQIFFPRSPSDPAYNG
jgi:hypothetical protein